jgi:hypothetical protein
MLRSFLSKTLEKTTLSNRLVRNKATVTAIKEELLSNPEFDNAFPHLSKHKPSTQLPRDKKELDFIRSLFYRWRTTGKVDSTQVIEANVRYTTTRLMS